MKKYARLWHEVVKILHHFFHLPFNEESFHSVSFLKIKYHHLLKRLMIMMMLVCFV